jgi:hypothetical protein
MTKRQVNIKRRYTIEKFINGNRFFKSFNNITDALCYKYIIILRCKVLEKKFRFEQFEKNIVKQISKMRINDSERHPLIQELYFLTIHFTGIQMIDKLIHLLSNVLITDDNDPVVDYLNSNLYKLFGLSDNHIKHFIDNNTLQFYFT